MRPPLTCAGHDARRHLCTGGQGAQRGAVEIDDVLQLARPGGAQPRPRRDCTVWPFGGCVGAVALPVQAVGQIQRLPGAGSAAGTQAATMLSSVSSGVGSCSSFTRPGPQSPSGSTQALGRRS